MTDNRTDIQAFLATQLQFSRNDASVSKAGIVPYIEQNGMRLYMAMKPVAKRPDLGEPEFQLCKGTRMFFDGEAWVDMRGGACSDTLEPLAETALREGIEELGLRLRNITSLQDAGCHYFTSASSGKPIISWMFLAKLRSADDFLPVENITTITAERQFFTLTAFNKRGRPDHAHMLGVIDNAMF